MLTLLTIGVRGGISLGIIKWGKNLNFIINTGVQARKAQVKTERCFDGLIDMRIREIAL